MKPAFYLNPRFQVISTWLWLFLFPLSLIGISVGILQLDLSTMIGWTLINGMVWAFITIPIN